MVDPENIELNRLQLQYKGKAVTMTVGRQRINLDDQRFVGAVGWRQNEQTFDAARIEAKLGPVSLDGTYAISQRTIFGYDAGGRTAYDGDFVFLGAGAKLGPVNIKAFAYLIDYDLAEQVPALAVAMADTQTYGLRATASLPLSKTVKLNLAASYARQSDMTGSGPSFGADYFAAEGSLAFKGFAATIGYELLGSDAAAAGGAGRAFQTPMATLHKFNGWADMFLVTPNSGLQDLYGGISYSFPGVKGMQGVERGGDLSPVRQRYRRHRPWPRMERLDRLQDRQDRLARQICRLHRARGRSGHGEVLAPGRNRVLIIGVAAQGFCCTAK